MKRNKLTLVLHVFEFILIAAIMLVYIGIMHRSTKNEFLANHAAELSQGWELMREGGSREKVVYPVAVHSKDGEICTYINTLPEIRDDDKLLFYSDVDTVITVDGAIRYRYETSENPFPGETVKNVIHQVGLIASDTGKEIRIIKGEPNCKAGKLKLVAIGDNYGLFVMMFRIYGLSFSLSCVILFLVFVITLLNIYLNIRFHDNTNIYTLIVGIFLIAIWCISNSMFFQYLFNISYVDGFMRYQVAMMLPIPFVMHLNRIQKYRYQRQYSIFESIVIVNFIVMNYLQAFTKYSFNDTMAAMCIPVAIVPVFAMITVFRDIAIGKAKEYKYMAAGYCGLCVFGFIELFLSGSGVLGSATYNGFFILVGIYFLLIMSLFVLLTNVIDVRNEAEDAVRANKMKSGFLARMSHEIRTPINAVLGMNEMILRESKESNIRDYAMDIKGAGNSLLYIINDILDLSKIEAGKMELVTSEYDLCDMLYNIVTMISVKAKAKSLTLITEVDETLPRGLVGDSIRISQCLLNLLNNSVKYTDEGSVTLKITGNVVNGQAVMKFSVKDTGRGIKDEDLPRLFENFSRIDEEKNYAVEGTGLGMSITSNLLELMDSKINVESEYGVGTCFYFELVQDIHDDSPVGDFMENAKKSINNYEIKSGFTAETASILVVDDKSVNRKVVRNLLKITKINVDEADGGKQCIEMCRENKYDVIFLDHMMPEMDGVETLGHIKKDVLGLNYDTPVVALTANAVNDAENEYLEAGFDGFLSKPVDYEKLERTLFMFIPLRKIKRGTAVAKESGDTESVAKNLSDTLNEKSDDNSELSGIIRRMNGIDVKVAMQYNPDMESLSEVLMDFYNNINNEVLKINKFYSNIPEEAAYTDYRITVHGLKSSAAMIGANALSSTARMLENAAIDHDLDTINEHTQPFVESLNSYKDKMSELAAYVNGSKNVSDVQVDMNVVGDQLRLLKEALSDFDMNMADNVVLFLAGFAYPSDIQEDMDKLILAVRNVDDDTAIEIINKLLTHI